MSCQASGLEGFERLILDSNVFGNDSKPDWLLMRSLRNDFDGVSIFVIHMGERSVDICRPW